MATATSALLAKVQGQSPSSSGRSRPQSTPSAAITPISSLLSKVQAGQQGANRVTAYDPKPISDTPAAPVVTPKKPTLIESVGNAAKSQISALKSFFSPSDEAMKLVPQLKKKEETPTKKGELPKIDKKTRESIKDLKITEPKDSSLSAPKTSDSAKLTKEAQEAAQKSILGRTVTKIVDKSGIIDKALQAEAKKAQRSFEGLASSGLVQQAYAPAGEETPDSIQNLVERYDQSNYGDKNKAAGQLFTGLVEGITGGAIKTETRPDTPLQKITNSVGNVLGSVYTMRKIGNVFNSFAESSTAIKTFMDKYPKLAKVVVPWAKEVLAFDIYGQLDPDTQNRFQKLAIDSAMGTLFAVTGKIKSGAVSIPTNFITGFGLAKLAGADDQDAFISGGIMATLDAAGRAKKAAFEPTLKTKTDTLVLSPDDVIAGIPEMNISKQAQAELAGVAARAKSEGKNIEFTKGAFKESSGVQDFFKVKTKGGVFAQARLVDAQPARGALPGAAAAEVPTTAISTTSITPVSGAVGQAQSVTPGQSAVSVVKLSAPELRKAVNTVMTGKQEQLRLDSPQNLQQAAALIGQPNLQPETPVQLYKAGTAKIQTGDVVTPNLNDAQNQLTEAPGAKIFTAEKPAQDLVMAAEGSREFVLAPKSELRSTPVPSEQQTPKSQTLSLRREKPTSEITQKLDSAIENYRKDSGVYTSADKVAQETPSLRELSALSADPEVVTFTQNQVAKLPKNADNTITLYRGGTISDSKVGENADRLVSAAYDRTSAENFVSENPGDNRKVMEFKVKPEDIKVFIGGGESEVLVRGSAISREKRDNALVTPDQISPMGRIKTSELKSVFDRIPDGTTDSNGMVIKKDGKIFPTEKLTPEILQKSRMDLAPDGSIKEDDVNYNWMQFTENVALNGKPVATKEIQKNTDRVPEKKSPTNKEVPHKEGYSRLQERLEAQLLQENGERYNFDPKTAKYDKVTLKDDAQKALKLLESNPERALRIAKGFEEAPENILSNNITLAAALKARQEGNIDLYTELVNKASRRSTRYGQEISSLRGQFNNNSPEHFMKQVIDARMERLGKSLVTDAQKELGKAGKSLKSAKTAATEAIDKEVDALQKKLKKNREKRKIAQDFLENLKCK